MSDILNLLPLAQGDQAGVYYTGTDAVPAGTGLCYVQDYGTATVDDGSRNRRVARPTTTNAQAFAGWTAYPIPASATLQWVDIWLPGSTCPVIVLNATTVNAGRVTVCTTALAGASVGGTVGFGLPGQGSGIPLQTTPTASTTSAPGPLSSSMQIATTYVSSTKTLTLAGAFTNAVVGDKVVVVGGRKTTSAYVAATTGVYTIATKTSSDVVILSTDAGAGFDMVLNFYVVRPDANGVISGTVLVKTDSAPQQSGLVEFLTSAGTDIVTAPMVGGTTLYCTTTNHGGAATAIFVDGTQLGQYKYIQILGTQTTNGVAITPTSSNIKGPGAAAAYYAPYTAITTITLDVIDDAALFRWDGPKGWNTQYLVGAVVA